ncbi:MAG TPA: hypothetical protein VHW00_23705 [Thermoanaerobaculia bacterium]|nr:hypothetical protein [Thermoanaerobaculia bacterium]
MRTKYAVSVLLLALGIAVAASVTGQEEPLPSVHTRVLTLDPAIVLAVEPIREVQQPTLADAVRRNDYATFHSLYLAGKPAEYRTLDELWTWAISDPVGAFYGRDMHDRLSRAYPGYASFIDEYKIIDSNGNVFYPTSETRTFLLQQALSKQAPKVQIASATPASSPSVASGSRRRRTAEKPVAAKTTPAPATTRTRATSVAPAVVAKTPATSVAPPVVAKTPATSVAPPVANAPVVATATTDAAVPDSAPQTSAPAVATPAVATPAVPAQPARTPNSGILLLVIGLIGVGLLAVILRTPREAQPTSILQPQPPEENKVEPIRRVSTEEKTKPRATGSHG